MVDPELEAEFGRILGEWQALGRILAELCERLAIESLVDVLPGASTIVSSASRSDSSASLRPSARHSSSTRLNSASSSGLTTSAPPLRCDLDGTHRV